MQVTVTFDLSNAAGVAALSALLSSINGTSATVTGDGKAPVVNLPKTDKSKKADAAAATNGEAKGDISIEQVRAAVLAKSQVKGKKDLIKELLGEYDAESVTKLDKSNYPEFMAKLEKL